MNILHLTFEYKPVAKLGGLAEVPYNLAVQCAKMGHKVAVFMPSHGQAKKLPAAKSIAKDSFTLYADQKERTTGIEIVSANMENVMVYVVRGLDDVSSNIVDDPVIYVVGKIEKKAAILARAARALGEYLAKKKWIPDIIHVHDWHSIPAALVLKEMFEDASFVYTIHLISEVKSRKEYLEQECGIKNAEISILTDSGVSRKLLFSLLEENNNMLEVMGMKIFDLVSSVSKSYLNESVLALCRDVSSKAAHIYNGTDWKLEDLQQKLEKTLGKIVYNRIELRKHVLTKLLDLPSGEPKIHDEQLAKIAKNFVAPPYKEDLRVEPFDSDGPLVVITGRLSKQKGIDTLLDAFKLVVKKIPDAKLLMMVLPISGEEELIEYTMKRAIKMRKNVRCLLGVAPSIYVPAHIAADVYACPSRFEPFGIMALEGMACGVPVVATRTGGLQETVIDIRNDPFNATGLLSPVEDVDELANNLETILALSLILEKNDMAFAKLIPFEKIVKIIETTPDYYELLRKNCILRVEQNFTWTHAAKMAIDRYGLAIKNHSLVKGK